MNNNELYHYGVKGMKWGVTHTKEQNSSEKNQNNKKIGKKITIGAAITAGLIAGSYGAYKLYNSRDIDRYVKAGKELYRMGHNNELKNGLNELVYSTIRKSDFNKYKSMNNNGTELKITSDKRIKIAGNKNAEKIYKDLLSNNKEFRSHYENVKYKDFNGMIGLANKAVIDSNTKISDTYMSPFFKELNKRGYDAVMDTQDKFAKMPVILINSNKNFKIN